MIPITIKFRTINKSIVYVKNFSKREKAAANKGLSKWGNKLVANLHLSVKKHAWDESGRPGSITNKKSIKWKQPKKALKGQLWMRRSGIALDSQPTHWVSLKRGRKITRWAHSKGIYAKAIQVRKHPWIDDVWFRHTPKLKKYIVNEINRRR